jgi:hypothetical protein
MTYGMGWVSIAGVTLAAGTLASMLSMTTGWWS